MYYESTSGRRLGIGMVQRGKSAVKVGQCVAQDLASLGAASTETGLDFEGCVETVWSVYHEQEKSYYWGDCEWAEIVVGIVAAPDLWDISPTQYGEIGRVRKASRTRCRSLSRKSDDALRVRRDEIL
jgi:hypothetical protein